MGKVLSFFQHEKKETPHFVVLEFKQKPELYRLTPRVMELKEGLYLLDLKGSLSYWEKIAQFRKETLHDLMERTLLETYGGLIVFCHHPFQGYLIYQNLKEKESAGIFYSDSKVTMNIYRSLSWEHWLECALIFNSFFEVKKLLSKERKSAPSQLARLGKLISSLGVKNIGEMEGVDFEDLQRRFSSFIGLLWKWTYPGKFKDEEMPLFNFALDEAILNFPWVQLKLKENPSTQIHLEYPLTDWDHIKPQLLDSFIKLTRLREVQSPYQVVEFLWSLTLYDLECCHIPISFKFPLDMLKERDNDFESLMVQFEFAFEALNERLKEKYEETDHINCAYIIGWKLEVTQTLYPSQINSEIFDQIKTEDVKFFEFQNKLKHPLLRYQVLPIHIPSLDFQIFEHVTEERNQPLFKLQPFHLLEAPKPLDSDQIKNKRFIERTSGNWWDEKDSKASFRDYYMCEVDKQILYVFRDYQGRWFQHGLFS